MNLRSESPSLVPAVTIVVTLVAIFFGPHLAFVLSSMLGSFAARLPTAAVHIWMFGTNWMYFAAQFVFPFNTYSPSNPDEPTLVNPLSLGMGWVVVIIAFSWFCRRLNLWLSIVAALTTVFLTTMVMHVVIHSLGLVFEVDGP
jgi:hypothetical protein